MTDDERRQGELMLKQIAKAVGDNGPTTIEIRFALISKMLMAYPLPNATAVAAKARAEAYLEALGDVPPWAVDDAIRKWHRGALGPDNNYDFAPSPAKLRQHARDQVRPYGDALRRLTDLLSAGTIEEAMA